jgi:hypothetical protein
MAVGGGMAVAEVRGQKSRWQQPNFTFSYISRISHPHSGTAIAKVERYEYRTIGRFG